MRRTSFSSNFSVGQTLPDDMRGDMFKSRSVVGQFSEVVAEHLFVEIPEQMERLDANVSAFQSAFDQAPEVFQTVRVGAAINVFLGMVHDTMNKVPMLQHA